MVEWELLVVQASDLLEQALQVPDMMLSSIGALAGECHPMEAVSIGADFMAEIIDMVERILLTIQLPHLRQQVLQLIHLLLPSLRRLPRALHPEKTISINTNLMPRIVHMVIRVCLVVQGPDIVKQVLQLFNPLLPCFRSTSHVPYPKHAVRVRADLAVFIVHVVLWVLLVVRIFDLLQHILELFQFCVPSLRALTCVFYPKEAINIEADSTIQIIHMVVRIPLVVQIPDLCEQVLELCHLAAFDALAVELHPTHAVCIAAKLTAYIVHAVLWVPLVIEVLDILQQVTQAIGLAAFNALSCIFGPHKAI
mmetsp:Transcript_56001/g.141796  ORF Transcript_56001/g.141796 Transcript_56001/m.141796 type:complete len:309 (+) Transcript_56001:780-1706(+)